MCKYALLHEKNGNLNFQNDTLNICIIEKIVLHMNIFHFMLNCSIIYLKLLYIEFSIFIMYVKSDDSRVLLVICDKTFYII